MRFYLLIIALFLNVNCALFAGETRFSTAGFFAVDGAKREVHNFNPAWRFYKGAVKDAHLIDFDDSKWEGANLPHGLEILGEDASGGCNYQGEAWYRKEFTVEHADGRLMIYFEGAMGRSEVWVNETLVAEQFGGYLPFAADITDVVKGDGAKNVVAVMVDNSDDTTYLPGTKQSKLDFAYLGGIYRDVYLIYTPEVHVTLPEISRTVASGGVFVATLAAQDKSAELAVATEVANNSDKSKRVIVKSILEDLSYNEITRVQSRITISKGASQVVKQTLKSNDVELWHPDEPNLNYVKTEVWVDGELEDCFRTRIGVRYLEMLGEKGMYINGEPFDKKLIGANRHQDYVYVGNALPNSGQWRDAKLLREGGCNVVRAAHYPMDDAFYDACDELGLVATTATPGWHFFNDVEPIFEERVYDDTRRVVRKDRNRPSIFMWETALNETPQQPERALKNMHIVAHEEYPYHGLFTVADMQEALKGGMDLHYHGTDPAVNSFTRECGDGSEVDSWYSHNAITRIKMEWGERALVGQAERLASIFGNLNSTNKSRLGGALWAGIEHQRGYHPDPFWGGLLNVYRLPKYSYYLLKSQTNAEPMVHIAHELTQASNADIIVYSNCDEVRLSYNGVVIGTQKPASKSNYKGLSHAPFVFEDAFNLLDVKKLVSGKMIFKAEMVAEGIINGEVVAKQSKLYPLRSHALTLEIASEGVDLVADGSDFVPVRAIVVDENGTKKVMASEYIYFQVEGEGSLVGGASNNANPMKSQMGVSTALVRATTQAGVIRISAHSPGLESATIEISSVASPTKLAYDEEYKASSLQASDDVVVINTSATQVQGQNVEELQSKIRELELDIVGKEQEIMELRSTQND